MHDHDDDKRFARDRDDHDRFGPDRDGHHEHGGELRRFSAQLPRGRADDRVGVTGSHHLLPRPDLDMGKRHAWNLPPSPPANPPGANLLATVPPKGEYLRWGDWSKAGTWPGHASGRIDPSSYRHDGLADPARLKLSTYGLDPTGPHVGAGLWKHHHEGFAGDNHLRGNASLRLRQTLNLNRPNFLGSGIFSVPRK